MRPDLDSPPVTEAARAEMEAFHSAVVEEVRRVVAAHDVVVVGMAWNQPVKQARAALDGAGVAHHYHEIGNYLGMWRERLAVKLWSGWPTLFVKGTLVGGASTTRRALEDGSLLAMLKG